MTPYRGTLCVLLLLAAMGPSSGAAVHVRGGLSANPLSTPATLAPDQKPEAALAPDDAKDQEEEPEPEAHRSEGPGLEGLTVIPVGAGYPTGRVSARKLMEDQKYDIPAADQIENEKYESLHPNGESLKDTEKKADDDEALHKAESKAAKEADRRATEREQRPSNVVHRPAMNTYIEPYTEDHHAEAPHTTEARPASTHGATSHAKADGKAETMPLPMPGSTGTGSPVALAVPGQGYVDPSGQAPATMYPPPGSRPLTPHSPYSPHSYGGYDPYGFPNPHPGVPSSTPPPPLGEKGKAKPAEAK